MFLDDRKRRILRAIIDDYVNTAEPIGSRTIARKHELGLSSATIRNEMADLEELGYLSQLHTSSGRIPSDKGYRLYVDQLMNECELTQLEIESVKKYLSMRIDRLSQLVEAASVVISEITKYTSIVSMPEMKKSIIKAVQMVPVEVGRVLIVVVTNAGVVRNTIVKLLDVIPPEYLIKISNILNEKLSGFSIEQINLPLIKEIENLMEGSKNILMPILNGVSECIKQIDNSEVFSNGVTNILNFPEFRDVGKAKHFLDFLDAKESILKILMVNSKDANINIHIGAENNIEEIKDCSLITATYSVGDKVIGSMGIIGPTRMEYAKVVSSLNYIRGMINEHVKRIFDEE